MNWTRFLAWFDPPPPPPPPPPAPHEVVAATAEVARRFNGHRFDHGFPALTLDPELSGLSQFWADSMARRETLEHGDLATRVAARYPGGITGEDIAMGQSSAADVVQDWMRSPGHRAQILNPDYRRVGVGVGVSPSGVAFWCADFRS